MNASTTCAVAIALLVSCRCGAADPRAASPDTRYRQLVSIVNRNTGHAHFTRGMNQHTIDALRKAVEEDDIPILQKMLSHHDPVIVMTAVHVLMQMAAQGRKAVYETILNTGDQATRDTVAETLGDLVFDETMKSQIPDWTEDIPLLKRMAETQDWRTIRTARDLLEHMGDAGREAIADILATTNNQRTLRMLKE